MGTITGSFDARGISGTVTGDFVSTPSGQVCGLDLAPTFLGSCKHDFVADLVPGDVAGVGGGDLPDPWPYVPEAHGHITGFHRPGDPPDYDVFFEYVTVGALTCNVPWQWRAFDPPFISRFSIGSVVYLYCEAPALRSFSPYAVAFQLFR